MSDQTRFCWSHHPVLHLTDCQSPHFHGHLCQSPSDDYTRSWSWTGPSSMWGSLSECARCDLLVEEMLQTLWILLHHLERVHSGGCSYQQGCHLGCMQASSRACLRPRHLHPGDNPHPLQGPMSEGCIPAALESHHGSRGPWG